MSLLRAGLVWGVLVIGAWACHRAVDDGSDGADVPEEQAVTPPGDQGSVPAFVPSGEPDASAKDEDGGPLDAGPGDAGTDEADAGVLPTFDADGGMNPSVDAGTPFVGTYVEGGIVRAGTDQKRIALVLTGGSFAEGAPTILDALHARGLKASFFVTGEFIRKHLAVVDRIIQEGHYIGPHSDQHLQYCDWSNRSLTLVTQAQFDADLNKNISDLVARGFSRVTMRYWIPPFEWFNYEIATWSGQLGMVLHSYTPGSWSERDWRIDTDPNFTSSQAIYDHILQYEAAQAKGLNGFLLFFHIGTHPDRTDKFHPFIPALLDALTQRGYTFERVDSLLAGATAMPPPK